jgi:hypothetical protein
MAAPLPVGKILLGAFLVPWWNRKAFARALAFPLALLATLMLSWYFSAKHLSGSVQFLLCVVYAAFFTLFAVTCHRLVLLDPRTVARDPVPKWSRREGLFFGWIVGAGLMYMVVSLVVMLVVLNTLLKSIDDEFLKSAFGWFDAAAKVPAVYLFARLSPLFPATALDRQVDLRWAWELTRGNGWRMVVVVGVLPWALSYVTPALYRSGATVVELGILTVAGIALFAVEIAALSISYRELTKG